MSTPKGGTPITLSNNQFKEFSIDNNRFEESRHIAEQQLKNQMANRDLLVKSIQLAGASGVCKTKEDILEFANEIHALLEVEGAEFDLIKKGLELV